MRAPTYPHTYVGVMGIKKSGRALAAAV